MATEIGLPRSRADVLLSEARVLAQRYEPAAWGAAALTAAFVAVTCWWVSQDHSIPIFDAGNHLVLLQEVHRALGAGRIGEALTVTKPYPPLVYLIGCLGFAIGGVSVASAVVTQNLVFVPLLAWGCYQIGKRAFGSNAGLLAVAFALGSPLATAQFHVFMTDAPETAMVAGAIALILATENFTRVGPSALAGIAVGLGMLTKEPFAFFVAGILAVALARLVLAFVADGWRREYGLSLALFASLALAIALPWYIDQYTVVHSTASSSLAAAGHPSYINDVAPPRYSLDNLTWYFWNFVNYQLYLPLFLFSAAGWIWMAIRLIRRQPVGHLAPELMVGAFVGWLAITDTFVHDTRYSEPMLVYLAVIGTGWIAMLGRQARLALGAVLGLVVLVNTLGTSFGVGRETVITLARSAKPTLQHRGLLTLSMNGGFLVGAPKRDGDILATFQAMRHAGVKVIDISERSLAEADFSIGGLTALADMAGLSPHYFVPVGQLQPDDAIFAHGAITAGHPPPCVKLSDGTGVWIRLGNPNARGARDYCPLRHPAFYG